jgi:hypothetical protein
VFDGGVGGGGGEGQEAGGVRESRLLVASMVCLRVRVVMRIQKCRGQEIGDTGVKRDTGSSEIGFR